jgi:hypothetical protein
VQPCGAPVIAVALRFAAARLVARYAAANAAHKTLNVLFLRNDMFLSTWPV